MIYVTKHQEEWLNRTPKNSDFLAYAHFAFIPRKGDNYLISLKMFIKNEIPVIIDGNEIFWFELSRSEQLTFGRPTLSAVILDDAAEKDRFAYFVAVNFTGVPQSEEHKLRVIVLSKGML